VVDNASVWWGLREAGGVRRAADERNRQPVDEQSKRADQVRLPTEDYVLARTGFASVVDDFYNAR
jgi:hypothetical protein